MKKIKRYVIVYFIVLLGVFLFRPASQWGIEYTIISNASFAAGLSLWAIIPMLLFGL